MLSISSVAEMEEITTLCNEPSFLKCTNTNKQECINSFKLTELYCFKKHPIDFDDTSNLRNNMSTHMKCTITSMLAYFDTDKVKLNKCFSDSKYIKNIEKIMKKESNK